MSGKTIACGGCGETNPNKRCIGCLHDFGNPGSAWVNLPEAATALAEAQAEIARLQDQVGDWIVRADEANARADRLEAACREIIGYVDVKDYNTARNIYRDALTDKPT